MQDIKAIIQALHYLIVKRSKNSGFANKMAVLKLFFFAQRYHLRKYGRLIADDKFVAMKHGPVASLAYNIMKENFKQIKKDEDKKFVQEFLAQVGEWDIKVKKEILEYDELSDTDIEALDFAIDNFGNMDQWQLVDETHNYAEWKKHENKINDKTKKIAMDTIDLFGENPKNSPFDIISKEQTQINKEFYLGNF